MEEELVNKGACVAAYLYIEELVKTTTNDQLLGERLRHYFNTENEN